MADQKTAVVITARDETAAGFASAGAALQRLTGQFASLANPIGAAATAMSAGALALGASVKSAIDTGDSFNKLSQKTGIAVESLSALAYAGELSDVSLESLATGIKKLSVNMSEAAGTANGKAAEAFKALGVTVKGNDGILRASDAVLGDIADRFAGMKDGAGKTALAVALFGKAGADLIPFLNQGSKGIADLTVEAEKLGLIMTGQTAKASEEFNDNIKKLTLSTAALGRSITADLIGPLAEYTKQMVEARKAGAGIFGSIATGIMVGNTNQTSLTELRERAGTLQGRISGNPASNPNVAARIGAVFSYRLERDRAELAILEKAIAARIKDAENFGPPELPPAKKEAPTSGGDDPKAKKAKRGIDDEYDVLEKIKEAVAKKNRAVDDAALALSEREVEALDKKRIAMEDMAERRMEYTRIETEGEEAIRESMEKTALKGKETFSDLTNAVQSWGNKAADTFADFVVDGKASFGDLVNSMLKDIVRLQAKQVLDPITKAASSWLTDTVGGFFKNADGGAYASADLGRYSGSVVSSPTLFRFANGGSIGLMGEAGAEAILPLQRGPNGKLGVQAAGGGGVTVNIIEDSSRAGQTQSRQEQGGASVLDVFVDRIRAAVAGDITRGNGPIPAAMAATYGLNRAAGGY